MTPPRSFSLSPCDARSRRTSGAGTTRRLSVTRAGNEGETWGLWSKVRERKARDRRQPRAQEGPDGGVENKQRRYSRTSTPQDVVSKTNTSVSP